MDKVAVVILNWNGRAFLEKFLPSVITHSSSASIVVADNNSTDDSVDFLKKNYPALRIIEIAENGGYSKGYNIALRQIEAEYYVLLNSDIEVSPQWLEPVLRLMDKDTSIAACQPKLLDYNNRELFEYAGGAGGYLDWLGYPFCRGRLFNTLEKDHGQYDDNHEIFWATGACMFVRASDFHAVDGLDDDFFAHLEEIDLCWRLKSRGKKIYCCSESKVYHVGGGTLNKINPRKTYLNFRNSLYMLYKNLTPGRLFLLISARLVLDGVAGIKFLLEGSGKHTLAVIKAHFSFYGALGSLRKKRKANILSDLDFKEVYKGSIVLDYFLKKKTSFDRLKF
ncbi:MAG TPA: glycosyltransferase family 2 protein [Cytophagaceae bacterium]|nr:glycosyltransferase family 2 protein [Cytophagaceae bacterium]